MFADWKLVGKNKLRSINIVGFFVTSVQLNLINISTWVGFFKMEKRQIFQLLSHLQKQ